MKDFVSIIIRSKDEEKWIGSCLKSIFEQNYKNFEVILVDNYSKDKTLSIAKKFSLKIIKIKKFLPGKAINQGIKMSKGNIIVCISAHCIPTNKFWLGNLIKGLKKKDVGAIYGRQEPLSFSNPLDKRQVMKQRPPVLRELKTFWSKSKGSTDLSKASKRKTASMELSATSSLMEQFCRSILAMSVSNKGSTNVK